MAGYTAFDGNKAKQGKASGANMREGGILILVEEEKRKNGKLEAEEVG